MRRILQPELARGHFAQRSAVLLLFALVTVLLVSVVEGVQLLGL